MMSVMSSSNDGRAVVEPPERGSSLVGELKASASTSEIGSAGDFGFGTVASSDEAARVGGDGSDETRIYGNASVSRVLTVEKEENRFRGSGGGENQPSSSVCKLHGSSKKSGSRSGKLELKKNRSVAEDYDSILSAFDQFAAKGKDEAVEYGFKIGDMVWGKVKSHPWWPGHIYDEAFASPAVRRGKHEGHLLVAFFGDSSYGWFDPEELIPFEENYAEKSRQTTSRSFVKAVEEAVDEIARRSSFGLACRCRNEFNLWPSSAEGYFVVDVGDSETGVYSMDQISKAQESFRPRDLVSFLHEVALKPMHDRCSSIDFVKQKAAALALRKALFEEFDETYAQAFGTQLLRPSRPTAPAAVDPSKVAALLGGRLVIAEALGKSKILVKPAKTKGQVEDKYLLKRREESIQMKSKKARSSQAGHSPRPVSVDGQYSGIREVMHQASESFFIDGQHQQASIDIKHSESSRKLVEGGTKKVKFPKRPAGESTAENAIHVKKKKRKGLSPETGGELRELRLAVSDSAVAADNISGIPVHVPPIDNNGLEDQKIDAAVGVSSSQSQQAVDFAKIELQMLVTDLRVLALNPFHGEQVSCPAVIKQVFLKFRSLVYQKSLVLVPPTESGSSEGNVSRLPPPAVVVSPTDKRLPPPAVVVSPTNKTNDKIVRPSVRLDDPTKGGKKRGPSERPEDVQKKKCDVSAGVKKKKVDDSLDSKKKKIDNFKSSTLEKKILQRSAESQHGDVKDSAVRVVPSTLPRAVKQESSKRTSQMARAASPTMLVMKFPAGAALPSIPQLKAKFARFGPLDQSGTRVFWKSYTCRLVYQYKIDAQAALKFAVGSSNVFGNANVRCFLREVENEAADSEPVKPQKEEDTLYVASQDRESAVEQRVITKMASQPLQPPQSSAQLKSCLKKPCGDEGGNGGGRSGRVKFVLGGKENSKGELLLNENKKNNIASFPQGDSSSSSSMQSVDSSSKILPKLDTFAPSPSPFQQLPPVSSPSSEQGGRPVNPPPAPQTSSANDISQQMLNLLMRCDDVVSNLRAALGCMPYHPL
ncbi:Tudor/PWWP/MBT superfamily protein [Perilla frutescens var. hirtella]|nr:Tudor/PWWP/MBT superfamily protein [Perilla frutescens var. hirtella]